MSYSISETDARLHKFKSIIMRYNINYDFAFRLRALEGFEIVLIIDDSTSMLTPIVDHPYRKYLSPFDPLPTRWDELKQTVSIVVDLASTLDSDGIDIYFLNRPPMRVHDSSELEETFSRLPKGPTPLVRVLSDVIRLKRVNAHDRKLLILIATDGIPTNEQGNSDIAQLEKTLRTERQPIEDRIHITFIACTNDLTVVGYLNQFDKKIPYVDVLDDYASERAEILAVQGSLFPFSFGDYVVKILMGSVDPWFDQLDEKRVNLTGINPEQMRPIAHQQNASRKNNCTMS